LAGSGCCRSAVSSACRSTQAAAPSAQHSTPQPQPVMRLGATIGQEAGGCVCTAGIPNNQPVGLHGSCCCSTAQHDSTAPAAPAAAAASSSSSSSSSCTTAQHRTARHILCVPSWACRFAVHKLYSLQLLDHVLHGRVLAALLGYILMPCCWPNGRTADPPVNLHVECELLGCVKCCLLHCKFLSKLTFLSLLRIVHMFAQSKYQLSVGAPQPLWCVACML
jgi:hypothetical protein